MKDPEAKKQGRIIPGDRRYTGPDSAHPGPDAEVTENRPMVAGSPRNRRQATREPGKDQW